MDEAKYITLEFEVGQFCEPYCDPTGLPRYMFGVPRVVPCSKGYILRKEKVKKISNPVW